MSGARKFKFVDDPFIPGQKTTEAMAKVHPSARFGAAIAEHYAPKSQEDAS